MKIIIPPLAVEDEDGFKNDALQRKSFGESLRNVVANSTEPLVISLDGRWGEGKTTFIKMWRGLLREDGIPSIYFDAFAHDHTADAFMSIASSLSDLSMQVEVGMSCFS